MDRLPRNTNFGPPMGEITSVPPLEGRVAEFTRSIGQVNPRLVRPMPDLAPSLGHRGEPIDYGEVINKDLYQAHLGPALLAEFDGQVPNQFGFELREGWSMGREVSQHGTFFGVFSMTTPEGTTREARVAVKEFPFVAEGGPDQGTAHHALQEYAMLQDLRARGLPAVEPLGIIVNRWSTTPGIYLLIREQPDLESLNAQDWTNLAAEEVRELVAPVPDTIAMLHEQGVFNDQLGFVNVAVGEAEGSRYIFDLETTVSLRGIMDEIGPDDRIPDEVEMAFGKDFIAPRVSLRKEVFPNLPPDQRPRTRLEEFELEYTLLYEPYHIAISRSSSPYKHILERAYRNMVAGARRQAVFETESQG